MRLRHPDLADRLADEWTIGADHQLDQVEVRGSGTVLVTQILALDARLEQKHSQRRRQLAESRRRVAQHQYVAYAVGLVIGEGHVEPVAPHLNNRELATQRPAEF